MAIAGAAEAGPRITRYARGGAKGLSTAHRSGRPGGDSSERRGTLSPEERLTLRHLADALVPSVPVESDPDGFYGRRASDLAIDDDVARIIESYISPDQRADFRRLLRTIESPWANLLLSGRPHRRGRFSDRRETRRIGPPGHRPRGGTVPHRGRIHATRSGGVRHHVPRPWPPHNTRLGVQRPRGTDRGRQLDDQLDDVSQAAAVGPRRMGAGVRPDRGGLARL